MKDDYISRQRLVMHLTDVQYGEAPAGRVLENIEYKNGVYDGIGMAIAAVENIPAADVESVVYCKDCTYCHYDRAGIIGCFHYRNYQTPGAEVKPYDYCSYAKRRTGQEDDRCYYERHNCGADMREAGT